VPKDIVKVKVNDRPIVFDVAPIIGEGRSLSGTSSKPWEQK